MFPDKPFSQGSETMRGTRFALAILAGLVAVASSAQAET
jgi:hypothetical protein